MYVSEDKPVYELVHQLKEKQIELEKSKYVLILNFLNKVCDLEMKTLVEFKKYNLEKIDMDQFEEVLEEYRFKLEGELYIDIDDIHINIVKILSDCLKSIDYSIISQKVMSEKTGKEKVLLTILNESFKSIIKKMHK